MNEGNPVVESLKSDSLGGGDDVDPAENDAGSPSMTGGVSRSFWASSALTSVALSNNSSTSHNADAGRFREEIGVVATELQVSFGLGSPSVAVSGSVDGDKDTGRWRGEESASTIGEGGPLSSLVVSCRF